jgi:DNA-binding NarL/FixJ family response regulator
VVHSTNVEEDRMAEPMSIEFFIELADRKMREAAAQNPCSPVFENLCFRDTDSTIGFEQDGNFHESLLRMGDGRVSPEGCSEHAELAGEAVTVSVRPGRPEVGVWSASSLPRTSPAQQRSAIKELGDQPRIRLISRPHLDHSEAKPATILTVANTAMVRLGLRSILEEQRLWRVIGEASTGRQAVSQAVSVSPNIVVVDVDMPDHEGVEAAASILKAVPETRVLVFGTYFPEAIFGAVVNASVLAYVYKNDPESQIVLAIRALLENRAFLPASIFRRLRTVRPTLTTREIEIIRLIAEGKSSREIADALGIKMHAVEGYRSRIMRKLCLESRSELVRYAVRNHIVAP